MRVAILTPCQDMVSAGYALDLAKLVGRAALSGVELVLLQMRGSILPSQREALVANAIAAEATHTLWIDADMRFPKDALERLLAHNQAIVAANYTRRRAPFLPTAEDRDRGYLFTQENSEGLAEVSHCGMGLMLVDMSVFKTLSEPWFTFGFNPRDKSFLGEDFYFCRKAKEAGFPIFIDQELSRDVKHAGEMEVSYQHALQSRTFMMERQAVPHGAE